MEIRYSLTIIVLFSFYFINCNQNNVIKQKYDIVDKNQILEHIDISTLTAFEISTKKGVLNLIIFHKNIKDSINIVLNITWPNKPQNCVINDGLRQIKLNHLEFDKYFVYIFGFEEPFPGNEILVYNKAINKLESPQSASLKSQDHTGSKDLLSTGYYTNIDTVNSKIESLYLWRYERKLAFYSWNIKLGKLDSTLLDADNFNVNWDSIPQLNNICKLAKNKIRNSTY